jgi:hypothetical protein
MMLTAYIDESGTHGPSPVSVMAGYVADARQWRNYEKRTEKLFRRYHVNVFHAIGVKRGDPPFKGWSVDKKLSFMDDFGVINNDLEFGFTAILRASDYEQFYAKKDRPKKVIQDTKYGVLFRATVAGMVEVIGSQAGKWPRDLQLNFVLETGHRNAPDAARLYDWCRSKMSERARKALGPMSFDTKANCLPLAAADHLAYAAYLMMSGGRGIGDPKGPIKMRTNYRHNCYHAEVGQPSLEGLYQQSLEFHEERLKFGKRTIPEGGPGLAERPGLPALRPA